MNQNDNIPVSAELADEAKKLLETIDQQDAAAEAAIPRDANGLRLDGPTLEEFVAEGQSAEFYPPEGYAPRVADPVAPVVAPAVAEVAAPVVAATVAVQAPQPPPPPPTPAKPTTDKANSLFFKKVMFQTPLFVEKQKVNFEPLGGNIGVIMVEPLSPLATALTTLALANRGGVVAIDESIYDDLKKKQPLLASLKKSKPQRVQVLQTPNPFVRKSRSVAAGVAPAVDKQSASSGVLGRGGESADAGAGIPASAPAANGFKPATGTKQFRMPVTKQTTSRSLEGGEPDLSPD